MELLDPEIILAACRSIATSRLNGLDVLEQTGSTNDAVLNFPAHERHARVVLAEQQSQGRGRFGRRWHSPFGRNIYLSLGWQFESAPLELSCLPLVVAIAASTSLHRAGLNGQRIKWPNDLVLDGRKLGGCLIETQIEASGPCHTVIGIGLNVHMSGEPGAHGIDQAWTDVASHLPLVSRNELAGQLIGDLVVAVERFSHEGFHPFHTQWPGLDATVGQELVLHQGAELVTGVGRGISAMGSLLLDTGERVEEFQAGEVTFSAC